MARCRARSSSGATSSEYVVIAGILVAIVAASLGTLGRRGLLSAADRLGSCVAGAVGGNLSACREGGGAGNASVTPASPPAGGCAAPGMLAKCGPGSAAPQPALSSSSAAATSVVTAPVHTGAIPGVSATAYAADPDRANARLVACAAQAAGVPPEILWAIYRAGGLPPEPDRVAAIAQSLKSARERYGSWDVALAVLKDGADAVNRAGGRVPPGASTLDFINRVNRETRSPLPPEVSCQ